MSKYPEHDHLKVNAASSQAIGEFIEWFEQDGRALAEGHLHTDECDPPRDYARFPGRQCGRYESNHGILYTWEPPGRGARIDRILALYFGIDREKLEAEKMAMLEELRAGARS